MICTDFEKDRYELSTKFCKKLGDNVVTVRASGESKKSEYCMQSSICGGCDMQKEKGSGEKS